MDEQERVLRRVRTIIGHRRHGLFSFNGNMPFEDEEMDQLAADYTDRIMRGTATFDHLRRQEDQYAANPHPEGRSMKIKADARSEDDGTVELRMATTQADSPRSIPATGVSAGGILYGGDVLQGGMMIAPVLRFSEDEAQAVYDALRKVVGTPTAPEPSREDRLLDIIKRLIEK